MANGMQGMYTNKIKNVIQKLYVYKRLEDINFDEIKRSFNSIGRFYKTSNTDTLNGIYPSVVKNFQTRKDYTEANITILSNNIDKYEKIARENSKDLLNIKKAVR